MELQSCLSKKVIDLFLQYSQWDFTDEKNFFLYIHYSVNSHCVCECLTAHSLNTQGVEHV